MSISDERLQKATERTRRMEEKLAKARELKEQGKTNKEIANEMGISESWVYQLLKNGMPVVATVKTANQIADELEERGKKMLNFAALLRGEKP